MSVAWIVIAITVVQAVNLAVIIFWYEIPLRRRRRLLRMLIDAYPSAGGG